jgi:hypothetical protein
MVATLNVPAQFAHQTGLQIVGYEFLGHLEMRHIHWATCPEMCFPVRVAME